MGIVTRCKTCGVPRGVSSNHAWLSNGTIVFSRDPSHRMVLLESDNLDGLFTNLEALLERPIEAAIIEGKSKATRDFLQFVVKGRRGMLTYLRSYLPVRKLTSDLCKVMGYGTVDLRDVSPRFRRAERMTLRASNVYSLPLLCGDFKGAAELVERGTSAVDYLLESGGSYRVTAFRTSDEVPRDDGGRITYGNKPGDIEWERCPACSVPLEVSGFHWDLAQGVITHPDTGRRLAIYGPAGLERAFDEIEKETGRSLDDVIVEAQRRQTHTFMDRQESIESRASFRKMLAVRGLGNLVSLKEDVEGLEARIENPCLTPILIGHVLAAYEVALNREARATWEKTPDGDLLLQLTP